MDAPVDIDAMRERIRFICAQGQEQWQESWAAVLSEPTSTRRGLVLPDVFLQTLQANAVFFNRFEARSLVERFQAPNGAVLASKFLQWIALSVPADHINPELCFARLPQPYRRIVKVMEEDILNVAWGIITTSSERYKSEIAGGGAWTARSSSSSNEQLANTGDGLENDFQAVKKRVVKPARRAPIATTLKNPRVVTLASHACAPFTAAVVLEHSEAEGNASGGQHVLQFVYTSPHKGRQTIDSDSDSDSGEAVVFPLEWWTPETTESAPPPSEGTRSEVHVGSVSSLQPLLRAESDLDSATSWCLAVRLVKVTTTADLAIDSASATPTSTTTRGQISVLLVEIDELTNATTCRRVAALNDADTDTLATIELSQDVRFLSLSSAAHGISLHRVPDIDQWKQQAVERDAANEANDIGDGADRVVAADDSSSRWIPPIDLTSTPGLALSETVQRALNAEGVNPPRLHFLVAPVTTSSAIVNGSNPFASVPTTYALVACVSNRVLKFLLPDDPSCQSVTPLLQWEHLSPITTSSVDASTELLVVACADGSLVVWNVLRDRDHSFMSTRTSANSCPAAIDSVLYRKGVIVALSIASQRAWFFDARKRSAPTLLRVVTPPPSSSAPALQRAGDQATATTTTITALSTTTTALGLPVAILHFSTGLAVLYDMRTAQATASVRTSSPLLSANSFALCGLGRQSCDQKQLEVIDVYPWDQLVPTNFSDAGSERIGKEAAEDPIALLYRLAGKSKPPPSPSSPKPKPLLLQPQATPTNSSQLERAQIKSAAVDVLALQPLVPKWDARFQQLCDERLDPQSMAERDATLARRQRAILKAVAATTSG